MVASSPVSCNPAATNARIASVRLKRRRHGGGQQLRHSRRTGEAARAGVILKGVRKGNGEASREGDSSSSPWASSLDNVSIHRSSAPSQIWHAETQPVDRDTKR